MQSNWRIKDDQSNCTWKLHMTLMSSLLLLLQHIYIVICDNMKMIYLSHLLFPITLLIESKTVTENS